VTRRIDLFVTVDKTGSKGGGVANFSASITSGSFPEGEVSLARKPDHCFFGLANLESHKGHAPNFATKADLQGYIDRVKKSVDSLVEDYLDAVNVGPTLLSSWEI